VEVSISDLTSSTNEEVRHILSDTCEWIGQTKKSTR